MERAEGFLVHAWASYPENRIYLSGRLLDGRSFGAAVSSWKPRVHVRAADVERALAALGPADGMAVDRESGMVPFRDAAPGEGVRVGGPESTAFAFASFRAARRAVDRLAAAGIETSGGSGRPAETFLAERGIYGPVRIEGAVRPGRLVDLVFPEPELSPAPFSRPPLVILSIDIETDERVRTIRAVSAFAAFENPQREVAPLSSWVRVVAPPAIAADERTGNKVFAADERELLESFAREFRRVDPDLVTGWNVIEFDLARLSERFSALGLAMDLGRAEESARVLSNPSGRVTGFFCPGRQVVDGMRVARSSPDRLEDLSLETAAREFLGEGKLVASAGDDKLAELDRLYASDPLAFARYCLRDSELALRVLAESGLLGLTVARSSLTGAPLESAWTSILSFERLYAIELRARGVLAPDRAPVAEVSGASGGQVLEPKAGMHRNVLVLDFRSLYPSLMRTFDLDPLALELARRSPPDETMRAPNGAVFAKSGGILPDVIARYAAERDAALARGDETASYVFKILQNSFYGVLGASGCRYARTELAGAITSFGRWCLEFARAWFESRGHGVLYGDTDSVFVESGLGDDAGAETFNRFGASLAESLNADLSESIASLHGVESFVRIRHEKAYRRFFLPRLRMSAPEGSETARGRAKGYAGLVVEDGGASIEVKGMEAVRSDVTPLARRFQTELLALAFGDAPPEELERYVKEEAAAVRSGGRDAELVYRKRLRRPASSYVDMEPPHVKAARALGWKNRRGTVEYIVTKEGPVPVSMLSSPPDYEHYVSRQMEPIARALAESLGLDAAPWFGSGAQLELGL
ncbi:MAG: DNA polymerase II [Spirochaetes bacterium]|nr:DNA polymerase II [Spirochaetota bacterium]